MKIIINRCKWGMMVFIGAASFLCSMSAMASGTNCTNLNCGTQTSDNYISVIYVVNCSNHTIYPQIQQNSQQANTWQPQSIQSGPVALAPDPSCASSNSALMLHNVDVKGFGTNVMYNFLVTGLAGSAVSIGQGTQGSNNFQYGATSLLFAQSGPGYQSYSSLFVQEQVYGAVFVSTLITPKFPAGSVVTPAALKTGDAPCQANTLTGVTQRYNPTVCPNQRDPSKRRMRGGLYAYQSGNLCVSVCSIDNVFHYTLYVLPVNTGAADPNYRQYPGNSGP